VSDNQQLILACIDESSLREPVCDYALWLAQGVGAPLRLLHAIDHHHETATSADFSGNFGVEGREQLLEEMTESEHTLFKSIIQERKAILNAAKDYVSQAGAQSVATYLRHGTLNESLAEFENEIRALVIGARGKTHEDQPDQLGEKLELVIRSLHCPILVAYKRFKQPKTIMIAYDGSESADRAVKIVANSPLSKDLYCHLVYVGKKEAVNRLQDKAAEKLREVSDIKVESVRLTGKADAVLCDYQTQHNIDMTIMGAFSHTRLHDIILGSFTVKMLLNTSTPLLLLR